MFKVFNIKTGYEINGNFGVTKNGVVVSLSEDGKWYGVSNLIAVPTDSLKKPIFTIVEPADYNYIDVFLVNGLYFVHDYNKHHDENGVWNIIWDIKEFKEKCSHSYSFIKYSDYTEEL